MTVAEAGGGLGGGGGQWWWVGDGVGVTGEWGGEGWGGGGGGGVEGGSSAYRHPPRANESYIAESGAPVLTVAAVCQDMATLAFTLTATVHSDPISPFCGTLYI